MLSSSLECNPCRRWNAGVCRRFIGACFICGQHGHRVVECPNNMRNLAIANNHNGGGGANQGGQGSININGGPCSGNDNNLRQGQAH